jgi:transposase-like protein
MGTSFEDFDIHQHEELVFPKSLPQFQKLFPDDAACAAYLEKAKWYDGFVCPHCHKQDEPIRLVTRPGVLACRSCRKQTSLTVGTVMERTKTPLSTWFWAAYLMSTHTAGMSALQFQRQLGIKRYETAFQILHKLRAGMVRHDADKIGKSDGSHHVEIDETWIGGASTGEGRGNNVNQTLVIAAVEVRYKKPKAGSKAKTRRHGRYAGRLRLQVIHGQDSKTLCDFVTAAVEPGTMIVTDGWSGYNKLAGRGYDHVPVAENGDAGVTEEFLPIVHLVFSNLKSWLLGCHHGVSPQHLQAYLNEFTFRFNRRFYPFNAFRSLLGIGSGAESPTYEGLYDGTWKHPTAGAVVAAVS